LGHGVILDGPPGLLLGHKGFTHRGCGACAQTFVQGVVLARLLVFPQEKRRHNEIKGGGKRVSG
jgi:hypothetical protein